MKLFLKKDIIVILLFLALALALFLTFRTGKGTFYEISYDGKTQIRESLFTPATHELEEGVIIVCEKGTVYFASSDCPDKVCQGAGQLCEAGEWAACLPNKIFLKVVEE